MNSAWSVLLQNGPKKVGAAIPEGLAAPALTAFDAFFT